MLHGGEHRAGLVLDCLSADSASIRDVQSMLGHTSPIMTLTRYVQPDVAQQRAAAGRVAGAILALAPGQNPDKGPDGSIKALPAGKANPVVHKGIRLLWAPRGSNPEPTD